MRTRCGHPGPGEAVRRELVMSPLVVAESLKLVCAVGAQANFFFLFLESH